MGWQRLAVSKQARQARYGQTRAGVACHGAARWGEAAMESDEFTALCTTKEQAHVACLRAYSVAQSLLANGENALVRCGGALEPIGVQQRRFLHGVVLRQISEQARSDGVRYTIDLWKEYFRQRLLPVEWVMQRLPGQKKATPKRVRQSTEQLGIRGYSKFIDEVIDHAVVDWSVNFHFTNEDANLLRRPPTEETGHE